MAAWRSLGSVGRSLLGCAIHDVPFRTSCAPRSLCGISFVLNANKEQRFLLYNTAPLLSLSRCSTIFTSLPADQLWEGVTGPRGSTKKRARGKRRVTRPKIDLHKGQRLGMGKEPMEWPGLNVPLIDKAVVGSIKKGKVNEAYFKRLEELRNKSAVKKKRIKLPPLLRGWTGSRLEGQSIGPPSPDYPEFDTRVIEMKPVSTMTATVGRYRRFSVLVATGNGRGMCGIGKAKSVTLTAAVRRAKLRAAQNLVSFNLKDNRTLWHIGHVREWESKIFAKPAPEGFGLCCHRLIRTLCNIVGIRDMYAKVEGSTRNYQTITRGFLRLLSEQKPYSELSNELGLHVVEFSADNNMYPRILASPDPGCSIDPNNFQTQTSRDSDSVNGTSATTQDDRPLPILAISHPDRHRERKPRPEENESFLDDLVTMGEEEAVSSSPTELIGSGERDLSALVLNGRVPLIRGKPMPFYWKNPGNLKAAAERHRQRNLDAARREREVYAALERWSIS
ncbi:Small subunit ribosomal protein S5 [Fasciola gigantica]|uniref:Small ribosomal subunit protein uS5m n=1 Tax=Fasciola gigantica TaxID=46835 RepID=A0A504YUN4_FASGI|nr:Small subunit ribosomal protein S5 [Fasciola gigantica]